MGGGAEAPQGLQPVDGVQVHDLDEGQPVSQSLQFWRPANLVKQALASLLQLSLGQGEKADGLAKSRWSQQLTTYVFSINKCTMQ